MNRIENLLKGQKVEWKTLGDEEYFLIANNKRKPVKASERNSGDIPYYGANNIQDYVDGYTHDGTYILIAEDGTKSLENYSIQWASGKFWANNHVHVVGCKENIDSRFVFHYLQTMNFIPFLSGGDRAKLTKAKLVEIPIPLPPLSVQQEIANILDKFTALEAELEAELDCRKRQYQYYRDTLLTFGDNVEWKTLGEVGEFVRGTGLQKKDFTETGVPAIHYGQIYTKYGNSVTETISFVSEELAKKLRKVNKGDVVITNTSENLEDVGKSLVYLGEKQAVTGGHATIIKPNENLLGKYLVYYTQTNMFSDQKRKYAKGTKVIDVSATDMQKIQIPIPPIEEQKRIVNILDKFDALTNSITEGLPKEIELRRKQYEYYREKLLSFPEN
ncbi:putative type I restriction enzyme specificity protein [Capnocytophaga stomatis]|uniref:restriction endonuclease subunit S n=1 Tax=Capnocytophaga stomatis TaxID=1848904 RepID=UPI0019517207|nr:restriction endonuclease subunit S [Capnocytophaga stomatis]GIJ97648.1 putative type I restriction enzyme specificity protein [Capnocytophaga stomatis]